MKNKDLTFVMILLAGSLSLNVLLGWRLRSTATTGSVSQNRAENIVGRTVLGVRVINLNDSMETIFFLGQDRPTVLYVLSPTCHWCDRNMDNIKTLAAARRNSFRIIGLSLTESRLHEYVETHKLDFPVYVIASLDFVDSLGLGLTPQTLVVSKDGKVERNWTGAFNGELLRDVEAYFGLKLPGVQQPD